MVKITDDVLAAWDAIRDDADTTRWMLCAYDDKKTIGLRAAPRRKSISRRQRALGPERLVEIFRATQAPRARAAGRRASPR